MLKPPGTSKNDGPFLKRRNVLALFRQSPYFIFSPLFHALSSHQPTYIRKKTMIFFVNPVKTSIFALA